MKSHTMKRTHKNVQTNDKFGANKSNAFMAYKKSMTKTASSEHLSLVLVFLFAGCL